MLTAAQLEEFERRGWTTVPDAVSPADRVVMFDRVWEFLEKRGLLRDDPSTWPDSIDKLQPLRKAGAFDAFLGPLIDSTADQLIGAGRWTTLGVRPQALITLPTAEPWCLPHKVWHLDLPGKGLPSGIPAVRYFGLLDDVEPRGGGTLVVEGSHELVAQMVAAAPRNDAGSSSELRKKLRSHEFFSRLADPDPDISRFMETGDEIDGVPVRVAEVTGRAGDLIVMHPWMMHNLSMNCSTRPRIAMTYSLYTTERSLYGGSDSRAAD